MRVSHAIKFTRLKTNEYSCYDNQILKARVSHMIKFIKLKTDKYNHNDELNSQSKNKLYD